MEQKTSNFPIFAFFSVMLLLLIAVICGMVFWIMQRSFELNEKLLAVRLEEARHRVQEPQQASPEQPLHLSKQPQFTTSPTTTVLPVGQKTTSSPSIAPSPVPFDNTNATIPHRPDNVVTTNHTSFTKTQHNTTSVTQTDSFVPPSATTTSPKKRPTPQETPEAKTRIGADGLPLDRITLPVGNEELDWQL